jgi:hypothetical protein
MGGVNKPIRNEPTPSPLNIDGFASRGIDKPDWRKQPEAPSRRNVNAQIMVFTPDAHAPDLRSGFVLTTQGVFKQTPNQKK